LARTVASSTIGSDTLNNDILLTCIFAGKQTLNEVGKLKKDDTENIIPELHDIFERNTASTRKYVFNLNQSPLTDRQLTLVVEKAATAALALCGIKVRTTLKETIANLWAFAALKSGIDAPTIVGLLGHRPANNPIFALCEIATVDTADRQKILSTVARSVLVNSKEWFVMRLRPMVKYADVAKRISEIEPALRPTLFYPCEEIQKRVNKKIVCTRRPVIPDIVFFKARITDVLPLFRIIGDKAWCYTTEGRNSGKYAIVPKGAMETFQRAIGKFTSDYEIGAIGTITPQKGDKIKIVGGIFSGNDGTIDKIEDGTDAQGTIYRVVIIDGQGIEWRVNVDSRLVDRNDRQQ
jgi:transcription antitermination factor NusG